MPHIEIKCFPGRTEEQKLECANEIAQVVSKTLGCKVSSVSVSIKEVKEENWKDEVWDKQIISDKSSLYKEPGYKL